MRAWSVEPDTQSLVNVLQGQGILQLFAAKKAEYKGAYATEEGNEEDY